MKKIMSAIVTVIFALCLFTATAMTSSAAAIKKVANFKAKATPTAVTLTWAQSKDATGYQIQQFKEGKWETIKTIKKAKTKKLKVKRLTPKKKYKFRICAVKNGKKGAYKNVKVKTNIGKVTSFTVEAAGANSAKLSWTAVSGANGYEIQQLVGGKWKKVKTVKKATSTTVANLAVGETTSFRIRAFATNMGKNYPGAFAAKQDFTLTMPEMSGVSVKSVTEISVTVAWKAVAGAKGYQIQKFDGSKWVDVNKSIGKGTLQYTVKGLSASSTVKIRIRAYAGSVYNSWYEISGSTKMGSAKNLTYSGLTATSVKLTWSAAAGAKGYYVKSGSKTVATVYTNSATVTLSPATNYTFTVIPFAGSVTGFATNAVSFTSAPAKVAKPSASSVTDSAITVTWAKTAGATKYSVQYCKDGAAWTTASTTANTYSISSLSSNTNYKFRVAAVNKNGSTEQSGEYSDILTVQTKLGALKGLTYSDLTATGVKLSWTAVSGATSYVIRNGNATVKTVNTTSAEITLTPATTYNITVTAMAGSKAGDASSVLTLTSKAAKVTGLAVTDIKETSVSLEWAATTGATRYVVQYSKDAANWTSVSSATNKTEVTGLDSCTDYTFRVGAVNMNGTSEQVGEYSAVVTAKTKLGTVNGLAYSNLTATGVKLTWNAVNNAISYIVKNGEETVATVTTTSAEITLTPDTEYSFTVTPVSKDQTGAACEALALKSDFVGYSDNKLVWGNVESAVRYEIYCYNSDEDKWAYYDTATSNEFIVTPEDIEGLGAVTYKVVAVGAADEELFSSDSFTIYEEGFVVSCVNNVLTLAWPAQEGATKYKVVRWTHEKNKYEDEYSSSVTQVSYNLAPGFKYNVEIYANTTRIAEFTVETDAINTADTSDASINGQLLYLAEAINRSKFDTDHDVTIAMNSTMVNSINYLDFGIQDLGTAAAWLVDRFFDSAFRSELSGTNYDISGGFIRCYDAAAISAFFNFINDGTDDMKQSETVTENLSIRFQKGYPFNNESGSYVFKKNFIQPSDSDDSRAYIYNSENPSAWKNGFSSVTTTKTADGYRIEAVLKAETTPNYHNGLVASFSVDGMNFGGDSAVSSVVGQTKIIIETDSENKLKSYSVDSPYTLDVKVELPLDMGESGSGLSALGNVVIEMNMDMTGSTKYEYTFTNND